MNKYIPKTDDWLECGAAQLCTVHNEYLLYTNNDQLARAVQKMDGVRVRTLWSNDPTYHDFIVRHYVLEDVIRMCLSISQEAEI